MRCVGERNVASFAQAASEPRKAAGDVALAEVSPQPPFFSLLRSRAIVFSPLSLVSYAQVYPLLHSA